LIKKQVAEATYSCSTLVLQNRKDNNMSKNTKIKLVGQPIIKQVLDLIDRATFKQLVFRKTIVTAITSLSSVGLALLR
jgi:hypothetical protein